MTKPAFLKAVLASVLIHGLSAITALAGVAAAHQLSDQAIWGVFTSSYRVRELSLYFYNVIPIYVFSFVVLAVAERWFFKSRVLSFWRLLALGLLAVPLSMAIHFPLFPWSALSAAMLSLFAVFFVSAYGVLGRLGAIVSKQIVSFPNAPALRRPLIVFIGVGILFTGGLRAASEAGYAREDQTFKFRPWPTPAAYAFKPSPSATSAPRIGLLRLEELPDGVFGGRSYGFTRVLDINGDGFMDVVFKDRNNRLGVAINHAGHLRFDEKLSRNIEDGPIGNFAFADFDGDGMLDVIFDQPNLPAPPGLASVVQGNIFWNFSSHLGGRGRLKFGVAEEPWKDVTERVFQGGTPTVALKSEPILVFDANGDGRLDFLWSGYPRPRDTMQKLYIQNADGTFLDQIDELLDHVPPGIFPEGSDVADIDGDGDIDFFGLGFLYLNEGGRYRQVCGAEMPGLFCDAVTRNEEGVAFEDMDGDGSLDIVMSFHGAGGVIPKYYLQLFRGPGDGKGIPVRDPAFGRAFYGAHYYMRAKDFDFDGRPEIILWDEGRIVTLYGDTWVDLMPALRGDLKDLDPISWIDIDEDGDWDILATVDSGKKNYLLRNSLNPKRYVKISALGPGGIRNQPGATVKVTMPDGKRLVQSYRPMGGYNGVTDPRIVFPLEAGFRYLMNVCFPSLLTPPETPSPTAEVHFEIVAVKRNCVDYVFSVSDKIGRLDLALIAGKEGATIKTTSVRPE